MKLKMRVLKHVSGGSEIRLADPPFETHDLISLSPRGEVIIYLPADVVETMGEVDEDDWYDGIQWKAHLEDLVYEFVGFYLARGQEFPEGEHARADIEALATALESAATMLRSAGGLSR